MSKYETIYITEALGYILENGYEMVGTISEWKQFKHCNAWYVGKRVRNELGEFDIYFLQSYETIVAAYNITTGEFVQFDWSEASDHTRTTQKQINQWKRYMANGYY